MSESESDTNRNLYDNLINKMNGQEMLLITLGIITLLLVVLFSWIFDRLGLKDRSCGKLDTYYPNLTNESYFNNILILNHLLNNILIIQIIH